ncbi:Sirohem biosynthesis protein C-terminal [Rhizoctonia solani]|uniref:Sirohem biosynthesis protein C-terminal n=1 Tax=Rhizoctonia solani TaxID=456999 RepID=A0A8H7IB18_9AGAM|nr:Sirohem biosynthesis protein C-terminal [Rhizoctonia solani]
MVRYPEPTRGASLLIALKPTRKPILVVGSGSLAASRIFSALEADADVLIASRGSIRHACEEVQWRVYHGDAEWLDATDAVQDDPDQQQTTFGALLDANPAIQLVCVTDTLNATEALPKRSAASAKAIARRAETDAYGSMSLICRPSVILRVRTQLAVTANGHGCRLASRLKREVVARLPRNVGDAVDNVGRLRLLARSEDEDPEALSSAMTMHDSGVQFFDEDDSSPINKPVPQRSHDESPAERCARRMRWVAQLSEYTPLEQLAAMDKAGMKEVLESRLPAKPSGTGKCGRGRSNSPLKSDPTKPPAEPETSIPSRHHLALDPPPRSDPTSVVSSSLALDLVKVAKKYPGNAEHAQDEFIQLAIQGARAGKCPPLAVETGRPLPLRTRRRRTPRVPSRRTTTRAPTTRDTRNLIRTLRPAPIHHPRHPRNVADSLVICTAVGKGGKGGIVWGYERARSLVILMGVARLGELVRCLVTGSSEGAVIGGGGVAKRLVGGCQVRNLSQSSPSHLYLLLQLQRPHNRIAPDPPRPHLHHHHHLDSSTQLDIDTNTTTSLSKPQRPPTPITSPLTLSGPVYPPSTPIAIIERASMPDQRLIATSLDRIERALEREGGGRPPGPFSNTIITIATTTTIIVVVVGGTAKRRRDSGYQGRRSRRVRRHAGSGETRAVVGWEGVRDS